MAFAVLGLDTSNYLDKLHEAIDFQDFVAGIIKAPFAAGIIGLVGCLEGMVLSSEPVCWVMACSSARTRPSRALVKDSERSARLLSSATAPLLIAAMNCEVRSCNARSISATR